MRTRRVILIPLETSTTFFFFLVFDRFNQSNHETLTVIHRREQTSANYFVLQWNIENNDSFAFQSNQIKTLTNKSEPNFKQIISIT